MSLKILLCKFVAFFSGQIPVKGHKNIINSFQKLIISPKRFIVAHGGIKSQSAPHRKHESQHLNGRRILGTHCLADFGVPHPAEWQRIGDQIKAASIFARSDFVNVRFSAKQDLGYQV
jgi:hypothetical protein